MQSLANLRSMVSIVDTEIEELKSNLAETNSKVMDLAWDFKKLDIESNLQEELQTLSNLLQKVRQDISI